MTFDEIRCHKHWNLYYIGHNGWKKADFCQKRQARLTILKKFHIFFVFHAKFDVWSIKQHLTTVSDHIYGFTSKICLALAKQSQNFEKIQNLLVKKDVFCVTQNGNFSKNSIFFGNRRWNVLLSLYLVTNNHLKMIWDKNHVLNVLKGPMS